MRPDVAIRFHPDDATIQQITIRHGALTIPIGFIVREADAGADEVWRPLDDIRSAITKNPLPRSKAIKEVFDFWAGMAIASTPTRF